MKEFFMQYFPALGEMANVHPVLVHFPIALLTMYLIVEICSVFSKGEELRITAKWMLYLGTVGALVSAVVGLLGAEHVFHEGDVHGLMQKHRDYGLNVLALSLLLSTWKIFSIEESTGVARLIQIFIGIVIVVNLSLGADRGALMVYKYGVAVDAVPREELPAVAGHSHGNGGIGAEIGEWFHGLTAEEHKIRAHSH